MFGGGTHEFDTGQFHVMTDGSGTATMSVDNPDELDEAGSGFIRFVPSADDQTILDAVATGDRFLLAFTMPQTAQAVTFTAGLDHSLRGAGTPTIAPPAGTAVTFTAGLDHAIRGAGTPTISTPVAASVTFTARLDHALRGAGTPTVEPPRGTPVTFSVRLDHAIRGAGTPTILPAGAVGGRGVVVEVGGVEWVEALRGTVEITHSLDEWSQATCAAEVPVSAIGSRRPGNWADVVIRDRASDRPLFAGFAYEPTVDADEPLSRSTIGLHAVGVGARLDHVTVSLDDGVRIVTMPAAGEQAEALGGLVPGFTVAGAASLTVPVRSDIRFAPVASALQELARLNGTTIHSTPSQVITFASTAPRSVLDITRPLRARLEQDRQETWTHATIRGSEVVRTTERQGDGVTSSWRVEPLGADLTRLTFWILGSSAFGEHALAPESVPDFIPVDVLRVESVTVDGVEQQLGGDEGLDTDWLFDAASQTLRATTPPAHGAVIVITYVGRWIAEAEPTTPPPLRIDHIETRDDLPDRLAGRMAAQAGIDDEAAPLLRIGLDLSPKDAQAIDVGDTVTIAERVQTAIGVDRPDGAAVWLIDEVRIRDVGDLVSYSVSAVRNHQSRSREFWQGLTRRS